MSSEHGKNIVKAFLAINRMCLDCSKLIQDCENEIWHDHTTVFKEFVSRDISRTLHTPDWWLPYGLFRYYDLSKESPGIVEGMVIYFWEQRELYEEPLLIVGQIKYRPLEETGKLKPKEWDLWRAYFEWGSSRTTNEVNNVDNHEKGLSRTEWIKYIAVPLFTIKSVNEVKLLLSRVREYQIK